MAFPIPLGFLAQLGADEVTILDALASGTSTSSNTATAAGNVSAGNNRKAIAVVSGRRSAGAFTFSSVTFGGNAMTSLADSGLSGSNNRVAIYELDDASLPALGAQNCVVTTSAALTNLSVHIMVIQDAAQGVGDESNGTEVGSDGAGNTSLSVTDGAFQIDVSNNNSGSTAFSYGSGQTDEYNADVGGERHGVSSQLGAAAGSEAMSATGGAAFFAYAAASFASA